MTHEQETHEVYLMLKALCDKLGITSGTRRTAKQIDDWARDKVFGSNKDPDGSKVFELKGRRRPK